MPLTYELAIRRAVGRRPSHGTVRRARGATGHPAAWEGHATWHHEDFTTLVADQSRVAVVLHQRSGSTMATSADVAMLRQRVREHPGSVCVILFDETPVPSWLVTAKTVDRRRRGSRMPWEMFALDAIASCRHGRVSASGAGAVLAGRLGTVRRRSSRSRDSTLRHELDAIARPDRVYTSESAARCQTDGVFELHVWPFR